MVVGGTIVHLPWAGQPTLGGSTLDGIVVSQFVVRPSDTAAGCTLRLLSAPHQASDRRHQLVGELLGRALLRVSVDDAVSGVAIKQA